MAKHNPGDILTCDWNPVVGCARYSAGCRRCWWLDGVMPWQQRLGNLPASLAEGTPEVVSARFDAAKLRPKRGLVGVVQHGDLFWDAIPDVVIHQVLDLVDQVAGERADRNRLQTARGVAPDETKYVLWTKRARRLADFLAARYPAGVPAHLACGVSVENQELANERLPHLLRVPGHRLVMIEPMLGPVDLTAFPEVSWVVLGSETGAGGPRPMALDWARAVRDWAQARGIPFFLKQIGPDHRRPERHLDGRTWDEFPAGFRK